MIKITRRGQQYPVGAIEFFHVALDSRPVESFYGCPGSLNRPAEGVCPENGPGKFVMHKIRRRILDILDLLKHDPLFFFDLVRLEKRIVNEVKEKFNRQRQMLVEEFSVEAGFLAAGKSV